MSNTELKRLLGEKPEQTVSCVGRYRKSHKCVSSGAALLTLVWTVVITASAQFLLQHLTYYGIPSRYQPLHFIGNAIVMSFYLVAGFLADVKLGRYFVINVSAFLLLSLIAIEFLILSITLSVVLVKFDKDYSFLIDIFNVPVTIVRTAFIANVIQYGMDQLHDSPADHQSLFIHWYMWAYMLGHVIARIGSSISFFSSPKDTLFVALGSTILAIFSTTAFVMLLVSLYIIKYRKRWFFVDKVRVNPYKSVYMVTKFAYKHKVPLRRSAFTYCEAEIPSGLDLGKKKYGGPFTTEQVEDVKVFYGILKVLLALGPTYYISYAVRDSYSPRRFLPSMLTNTSGVAEEAASLLLSNGVFNYIFIVFCLSLHLCLIRPLFIHYIPGILKRLGFATILTFLAVTLTFISAELGDEKALVCNFQSNSNSSQSFSAGGTTAFTIAISIASSLSLVMLLITSYELICSQSPRFMKGFLIGLSLTFRGVISIFASIMEFAFSLDYMSFPGCGAVYYLINIVIGILGILTFVWISKKYKYRKRDDVCQVYRYVDDYYSKVVQHRDNVDGTRDSDSVEWNTS